MLTTNRYPAPENSGTFFVNYKKWHTSISSQSYLRRRRVFGIILFMVSVLGGCVPYKTIRPPLPKQDPQTLEFIRGIRADQFFLAARAAENAHDIKRAEDYYRRAYDLNSSSKVLRDILIRLYLNSNRTTQALLLIKNDKPLASLTDADKSIAAKIYIRMGDHESALTALQSIQKKSPDDIFTTGLIYESKNNFEKAITEYLAYSAAKPDNIAFALRLGQLLRNNNRFNAAESLYIDLWSRTQDNADIMAALGSVYLSKGDTAAAKTSYATALLVDSLNTEALRGTALFALSRHEYATAIPLYEKLMSIDTNGLTYGKTLALLYYYINNYALAADLIDKLLPQAIEDPDLHMYRGMIASAHGNKMLAALEYEKVIALDPQSTEAKKNLIRLSLRDKNYEEASRLTNRFLASDSLNAELWQIQGSLYNVRKEYPAALKALQKALSLDSVSSEIFFDIGSTFERSGDIRNASLSFKKALAISPDEPSILNYLGYMWAEQDTCLDSARILLKRAVDLDSTNGAFLDSYAWILFKKGDLPLALATIKKALQDIHDDPIVYEHLGDILAKSGKHSEACAAYKKSLSMKPEHADKLVLKLKQLTPPCTTP